MKPYLFAAFICFLIVVTFAMKGCDSVLVPALTAAASSLPHHSDKALDSIPPSTNDGTKPSAGVPFGLSSLMKLSPSQSVVAPDPKSVVAIYRSPLTDLERVDEAYLSHVTGHLDIAMYSFTDQRLAEAIVGIAASGIPVRIYRDQEQYQQEQAEHTHVSQLLASSPNIYIKVKGSKELMHIKGWSDARMLRDGSANWSPSGEIQQDNTLVLTTDQTSVRSFEANFEAMWKRSSNVVIK